MKKTIVLTVLALFISLSAATAQSADKITDMLNTKQATYGQVAYVAAVYQGLVPETADEAESVKALAAKKIIAQSVSETDTIKLGAASFIFAKATGMRGGLFYTIHPCARYAIRQLKADNILPATADSSMKITGADALNIFNGCLKNYTTDSEEAAE